MPLPTVQHRKVLFSGRVQGVGFRYTTQRLASGFDVTGCVRNLSNGQVELLIEGAAAEIDRVIQGLHDHFGNDIQSIDTENLPSSGDYAGFTIRR